MLSWTPRARSNEKQSLALAAGFDSARWQHSMPVSHRFDKLGNPMPLELHGCGCGLCARQQRELRKFWEAR